MDTPKNTEYTQGKTKSDGTWINQARSSQVFLFEFKVVEIELQGRALQQIKDMGYTDIYADRGEPMHLIGVEFSKASRNIVGFEVETISQQHPPANLSI